MSGLGKRERAAIDSVARHVSARWEEGGGSPDAWLTVGGRRIAIAAAAITPGKASPGTPATPRLRFDKVVLRLVGGLRDALSAAVPDGQAVILTVTAPIRLPGKTADALEAVIRDRLARRRARVAIEETIHGNQIRVRLARNVPRGTSKLIGFVHNPDTDGVVLLDLTQSLLQHVGAAAGKPAPGRFTGDRWLVVAAEDGLPPVDTCRQVYSQLSIPTGFKKILMVRGNGRVETLAG